jgi:hypothetical protein
MAPSSAAGRAGAARLGAMGGQQQSMAAAPWPHGRLPPTFCSASVVSCR